MSNFGFKSIKIGYNASPTHLNIYVHMEDEQLDSNRAPCYKIHLCHYDQKKEKQGTVFGILTDVEQRVIYFSDELKAESSKLNVFSATVQI